MSNIVLIEANGTVKQVKAKDISRETLYKKAGFRSNEHFDKAHTWSIEYNNEMVHIELWAKTDGKATNENKYDFPPPVDNELYFGSCVLIRVDDTGQIINLTSAFWLKVYEQLFGGFETIDENDEDSDKEDDMKDDDMKDDDMKEDDVLPNIKKTKHGYIKDNFVVDEEEEDIQDDDEEDEENDDDGPVIHSPKKTNIPKNKRIQHVEVSDEEDDDDEEYYGSELEEEAYSYSDEE